MEFLYLKSLHIIFVVTWFAGLFYLPRLLVYAAEAQQLEDEKSKAILLGQYRIMQKRLLYGITWPSAIITLLLASRLLMIYPIAPWLLLKLGFVLLLYCYHFSLQAIFNQQKRGVFKYSGQQLRIWNEVPTILLFSIVFLVIFKDLTSFWWGLLGLAVLIVLLMSAIKVYKLLRKV